MNINEHFTLFVVDDAEVCRDFYVEHLGFTCTVDMGWYAQLQTSGDSPYGLAFMTTGHESQQRSHDAVASGSLFVSLVVDDATAERDRLVERGVRIAHEMRDEPWGQRHFILEDPAGLGVDIIENIEPDPDFLAQIAAT